MKIPDCFVRPPVLDASLPSQQVTPKHALLINPFYAKDPHASFGKHVLTPTLALTSIAGATPADWTIRYWDENLLQGAPPLDPFPQVVGITVHLTFAKRAYALADWYRSRGSIVVMGGLHVMSCPDEVRPHADILAIGEGVQCWRSILEDIDNGEHQPVYTGSFRQPFGVDPPPRRDLLPRSSFLTTTSLNATRGCHSRCGYCYLSTKRTPSGYSFFTITEFKSTAALCSGSTMMIQRYLKKRSNGSRTIGLSVQRFIC